AMKSLSGQRAFEDRGRQCVQLGAKPVDVLLRQRGRWAQLGEQSFKPVPRFPERWQVTRKVGEHGMQSPQRTAELPWLRGRGLGGRQRGGFASPVGRHWSFKFRDGKCIRSEVLGFGATEVQAALKAAGLEE